MNIVNLRQLLSVRNLNEKMFTHTSCPVPFLIDDAVVRVFFSSRGSDQIARVFYLDYDLERAEVSYLHETPVLSEGQACFYDDSGVYPSCIVSINDKPHMYFMGRTNKSLPHYVMGVGLALLSADKTKLSRVFTGPVLGPNKYDPWMVSTPWVTKNYDGYQMYYLSGDGWSEDNTSSFYRLKMAISEDGIDWQPSQNLIKGAQHLKNVAKPCVLNDAGSYALLFSYVPENGSGYRLGFIKSEGNSDDFNGDVEAPRVWDKSGNKLSHHFAYPSVIPWKNKWIFCCSSADLGKSGMYIGELEMTA